MKHLRADFPLLQTESPPLYFDTAATALKPACVISALTDFYSHHYGTVHRAVYSLAREATARYQAVRSKVAHFLNASSDQEIIFTRGTTDALNLVAASFGKAFLKSGDVILIPEIEHHSNIVPWQMLSEERGIQLKTIPVTDKGEIDLEAYYALLTPEVKFVSLAHISNSLGTLHPLEKIITAAHAIGAHVCIDGAQSAAHLPIDVQALDCDFFAFSGHKAYGPTGVGILYGKRELLEQMPPVQGGGDMIDQVTLSHTTYASPPERFEAGTPMIAQVIGLGAALDYLTTIGLDAIHAWEQKLLTYTTQNLMQIPGLKIIGEAPQKGALLSFTVDQIHPLDLATLLDCRNIALRSGHQCSQPTLERFALTSTSRFSFGLYNTPEEIDTLLTHLQDILSQLHR